MRRMRALESWELDKSTAHTWNQIDTIHTAERYGRTASEETGLSALKRPEKGG